MKLVIHTQHKENYGAHDWDGEGECPQYWKFKGGDTYVVEGLTDKEIARINKDGIPTLSKLIESASNYFIEYITMHMIVADEDTPGTSGTNLISCSTLMASGTPCKLLLAVTQDSARSAWHSARPMCLLTAANKSTLNARFSLQKSLGVAGISGVTQTKF